MEIINNDKTPRGGDYRGIYTGTLLVLSGFFWLLYNFDAISCRAFDIFFSWQMLLMVIGGYLLSIRRWCAGAVVAGIGALFMLAGIVNISIPFDKVVLPGLVIMLGIVFLVRKR